MAQINCQEIKKFDIENRLPDTGILYFFYELETMFWGYDPKDKGCARVYYYDGDLSNLKPTDFPKDMHSDYMMPEIKLSFNSKYNAPSFQELSDDHQSCSWEEYNDILEELGYSVEDDNSSKLLGYSDIIQSEMLLECELVTNGLFCGDCSGYNSPLREKLEENKDQWKLLFQLDTVETDDFELMFGDCGRIYYFIKETDLKNRDFNSTWLIMQCY